MQLPLLNKFRSHSVGLYADESGVEWAVSALTIRGRAVIASGEAPCDAKTADQAITDLVARLAKQYGHGMAVAVGMPAGTTFYATVPQTIHQENPASVLARHASLNSIAGENLAADLVTFKVRGRALAAIAGCRKQTIQAILSAVQNHHLRLMRVEPAPWSLLRSGEAQQRRKLAAVLKRTPLAVRVFLRGRRVLAVLCSDQTPLLWRALSLSSQADPAIIEQQLASTIRNIGLHLRQHVGDVALDEVILEGMSTSPALAEGLAANLGLPVRASGREQSLGTLISRELAMSARRDDLVALDLARPLRPPPSLWALVPRGEAAVLVALIVVLGLWLSFRGLGALQRAEQLELANRRDPTLLAKTDTELKREQQALTAEVGTVSAFLANRMQWSSLFNALASGVPDDTLLTGLWGEQQIQTSKGGGKRQVLLSFATRYPIDGPVPPQVHQTVAVVSRMGPIARRYPLVELVSLQAGVKIGKNSPDALAQYSILCLPKGGKKK